MYLCADKGIEDDFHDLLGFSECRVYVEASVLLKEIPYVFGEILTNSDGDFVAHLLPKYLDLQSDWHGKINSRIGASFLRENKELLL